MIHEEIVTHKVAKLAKDKGFDWGCLYHYDCKGSLHQHYAYDATNSGVGVDDLLMYHGHLYTSECLAPAQSLLQRWLREEKNIHIEIIATASGYYWCVNKTNGTSITDSDVLNRGTNEGGCFDTYELALEDALACSLKNLV